MALVTLMSDDEWRRTASLREALQKTAGQMPWLLISAVERDGMVRRAERDGAAVVAAEVVRVATDKVRGAGHEPFW